VEILQAALAERRSLQIVGGGSKRDIGNPDRTTDLLSMARFDRMVDYDPAELVLTVGAGVTLAHIEALLATHEQMLAFEPFDFAAVSGRPPGASTIGGIVAAGIAGPRRVSAGNVRDHVLGFSGVSGRGEAFVAGGRVVKNVTGYDVSKLMCGSWGQLAVLTQVSLKVLPRPRTTLTLMVRDLDDERAGIIMTRALRSQAAVAAAAYIPQGPAGKASCTLLRLEGFPPSVEVRSRVLAEDLSLEFEPLAATAAGSYWSAIATGAMLSDASSQALWRIAIPGTAAARCAAGIRALNGAFCCDWGGSLVLASIPEQVSPAQVRALAESIGGHATMLRASPAYRRQATALHPERPEVAALADRVKSAFDPAHILDPLRFAMTE
jgi:glycolate oxidase FAD binding subunit